MYNYTLGYTITTVRRVPLILSQTSHAIYLIFYLCVVTGVDLANGFSGRRAKLDIEAVFGVQPLETISCLVLSYNCTKI